MSRWLGLAALAGAAGLAGAQSQAPSSEHEARPATEAEAAQTAPADVIRRLHAGLAELAAESGDAPLAARIERLRPLIAATHDLPYIAELTIRREWASLSGAERDRFVDAFERLSVATYASRFADIEGDPFRTLEAGEPDNGRAEVRAEIDPPDDEPIPLDYLLHDANGRWQIINIVADGVSDLALKRAEYRAVLQEGDIDDLIAELESQIAAMD